MLIANEQWTAQDPLVWWGDAARTWTVVSLSGDHETYPSEIARRAASLRQTVEPFLAELGQAEFDQAELDHDARRP